MKKISMWILVSLFLVNVVVAIEEPPLITTPLATDQPLPPDTNPYGECKPYEVKNEQCENGVRHWDECIQTISGDIWRHNSEICKTYGPDVICLAGKCRKSSQLMQLILYSIGALVLLALIIFGIVVLWRRK